MSLKISKKLSLPVETLTSSVEASATSSTFANNLSALRTLGLIDYPTRGSAVATELLFPKVN